MGKPKRVMVVTGSRAEYGLLKPTMKAIQKSRGLELIVAVCGMHLLKDFGSTWKEVETDFEICYEANTIQDWSRIFNHENIDFIVVLGDRIEILECCVASIPYNIPIVHLCGGEVTEGMNDDRIRNAITKLAHLHFPCCKEYAKNILDIGEEKWRIKETGHPMAEIIRNRKWPSRRKLFKELGLDAKKKTHISTLHPSRSLEDTSKDLCEWFKILSGYFVDNIVITYPNNDPGSEMIVDGIDSIKNLLHSNVHVFKSLGDKYLDLMNEADGVIGNSSSMLVEARFLGIPTRLIGHRQDGRTAEYNYGSMSDDVVKTLEKTKIDDKLMIKRRP